MILQNKLSNLDSITYDYASLLFFNTKNNDTISNQIYINNLNYYLSLSSFHLYFLLNFSERFLCIKFDDRKIKNLEAQIALYQANVNLLKKENEELKARLNKNDGQ